MEFDKTPETFEEAVDQMLDSIRRDLADKEKIEMLLGKLREVLISKQADYGPGNILKFGEFGVLVRVNDKIERLRTLLENNAAPKNESILDSWEDLTNYGIIAQLLKHNTFGKPLSYRKTLSVDLQPNIKG